MVVFLRVDGHLCVCELLQKIDESVKISYVLLINFNKANIHRVMNGIKKYLLLLVVEVFYSFHFSSFILSFCLNMLVGF